jgi:hypothetical protein
LALENPKLLQSESDTHGTERSAFDCAISQCKRNYEAVVPTANAAWQLFLCFSHGFVSFFFLGRPPSFPFLRAAALLRLERAAPRHAGQKQISLIL